MAASFAFNQLPEQFLDLGFGISQRKDAVEADSVPPVGRLQAASTAWSTPAEVIVSDNPATAAVRSYPDKPAPFRG